MFVADTTTLDLERGPQDGHKAPFDARQECWLWNSGRVADTP